MKAYKLELLVIDFDNLGGDQIKSTIENTSYPNRCISPSVETIHEADIGAWDDDHPLNKRDTTKAEYERLFAAERTTSPVSQMTDAPDTSQDWAKLDGATAFHLIERHAEDWAETGHMMESWLAARIAAAAPAPIQQEPQADESGLPG